MTTPDPAEPQPRDIALEMATPEQAADLESQSEPALGTERDTATAEPDEGG